MIGRLWTRPAGVRVDGPPARGLCRRVVKGKVLKMDGPSAQGFLSLTGPLAPRVADCSLGAQRTHFALCELDL